LLKVACKWPGRDSHPQRESYEFNTIPLDHLHLQRHMGVNNLPRVVTRHRQCAGRELNLQPLDYKSNTLPLHYRATQCHAYACNIYTKCSITLSSFLPGIILHEEKYFRFLPSVSFVWVFTNQTRTTVRSCRTRKRYFPFNFYSPGVVGRSHATALHVRPAAAAAIATLLLLL